MDAALRISILPGRLSDHDLLDDKYVYRLRMMSGSLSAAMEQGCWCELQGAYFANWKASKMVFTEEMLAATDWLPTLAAMVGASNLVPKDRPIDGIDASKFLLGMGNTTGRDTYMFFGPDGELMSIKQKMFKTIFRYSEGFGKPIVKPQFPIMFDLSSDPHERWNLFETRMDNTSTIPVAFRAIRQYEMSVKKYPNIKPGEEFTGYKTPLKKSA